MEQKTTKKKITTFLQLFRSYIAYHENTNDYFDKRKSTTIINHANKYKLINEFLLEKSNVNLAPGRFNTKLANRLFEWLRDEKKHSHNYAARVAGICKLVLTYGLQKELINVNNLQNYAVRKLPPNEPPYFSPEEVRLFENYKSDSIIKQKAADMFAIQLHTGFDYGDFAEVSRQHIMMYKGSKYLVKPRHKNGNKQIIPISDRLEQLLEKHNYSIKLLSNPKYNLTIKEIAKELGIQTHLTAKAGRKLFMMNKLNNEHFTIEAVSKMGGHKSIATTETYYARVDISLIHNELAGRKL